MMIKFKKHWFSIVFILIILIGVGYMGFQGYVLSQNFTSKIKQIKSSKTIKEVYNQNEDGKKVVLARKEFNLIIKKYEVVGNNDLKNRDNPVSITDISKLKTLVEQVGPLHENDYQNKYKTFAAMATINNNYLKLWKVVNKSFLSTTTPSTIYQFNAENLQAVQDLESDDANNKFASYMQDQMVALSNDAGLVNDMLSNFTNYYSLPVDGRPFVVENDYLPTVYEQINNSFTGFKYHWPALNYFKQIVDVSKDTANSNLKQQTKYDEIVSWNKSIAEKQKSIDDASSMSKSISVANSQAQAEVSSKLMEQAKSIASKNSSIANSVSNQSNSSSDEDVSSSEK